jgi:hypothetical protein
MVVVPAGSGGGIVMPGSGIFISYRRDDTSGYAGRLYDRLVGRFGNDRVFMDIDTIAPGHEFATDIDKALTNCDACVVLIGRQWLSITDADGHRRLDDPTDFVRLEVGTAIRRGITVFPVIVDRASPPASAALPDDLRPLAGRQAIELTNERWNYDTGRLLLALEEELGVKPSPVPPRTPKPARTSRSRSWKRPALIGGAALLAVVVAVAAWVLPGSGEPPPLDGTYDVRMTLESMTEETFGPNNALWNEPDPQLGDTGDDWAGQEWVFTADGVWRVVERHVIEAQLGSDGSYVHMGHASCEAGPSADVTRTLTPLRTDPPGSPADTFIARLTIHWQCEGLGPFDALFSVEGTRRS